MGKQERSLLSKLACVFESVKVAQVFRLFAGLVSIMVQEAACVLKPRKRPLWFASACMQI
jgi:hypothetical protein